MVAKEQRQATNVVTALNLMQNASIAMSLESVP